MPTPGEKPTDSLSRSLTDPWLHTRDLEERQADFAGNGELLSGFHKTTSSRNEVISIAVIDEYSFTRESISRSLRELRNIFCVISFADSIQCLESGSKIDVIMYHAHDNTTKRENNETKLACVKQLITIAPTIMVCDVDSVDLICAAFDSGVRGYIPTESTTLEVAIEIIYLVKAGGTFVPPSSLSPQRIKLPATRDSSATCRFTSRQLEVLERLRLGQTNKNIAFGLKMSESSVKTHIQNIMRKLGATNRTEVACLVHQLEISGIRSAD